MGRKDDDIDCIALLQIWQLLKPSTTYLHIDEIHLPQPTPCEADPSQIDSLQLHIIEPTIGKIRSCDPNVMKVALLNPPPARTRIVMAFPAAVAALASALDCSMMARGCFSKPGCCLTRSHRNWMIDGSVRRLRLNEVFSASSNA